MIRLTNIRVYELREEIILIEHDGKMKEKISKKPKITINKELDITIDIKDLLSERMKYKKNDTDVVQFTYEHLD